MQKYQIHLEGSRLLHLDDLFNQFYRIIKIALILYQSQQICRRVFVWEVLDESNVSCFENQWKLLFFHLNQKMSVLSQKLQEATKLFQTHSFKKSLEAYQECIDFCYKTDQAESIVFNILSTKATLQYILGDYDDSLITLNSVLKKDPNHFLCLLRRSQVYKKKNKLKRALKDLQTIFVFCPDNLQISAFKVEIQHLLLKQQKQHEITSQSQQQEDQEMQLNFIQLKLIDRKSIDSSAMRERKSRVTILGDSTFEYKRDEQTAAQSKQSENIHEKAIRTYKQIDLDDQGENQDVVPLIQIKTVKKGKKSILKNKGTSIFVQGEDLQSKKSKYLGRQSKLIDLIKNIDGKIIPSSQNQHHSHPLIKEVQFRKSINEAPAVESLQIPNDNKSTTSSRQRKSCLKRPSFEAPKMAMSSKSNQTVRKSRFQSIDSSKIDGHIIVNKKRKSIDKNSDANSQGEVDQVKQESQSDNQGSEHNIFGSKQYFMSQDLKQKLGFTEDMPLSNSEYTKFKGKKSILKKNSSVILASPTKKISYQEPSEDLMGKSTFSVKSKKSVMFNCTL